MHVCISETKNAVNEQKKYQIGNNVVCVAFSVYTDLC